MAEAWDVALGHANIPDRVTRYGSERTGYVEKVEVSSVQPDISGKHTQLQLCVFLWLVLVDRWDRPRRAPWWRPAVAAAAPAHPWMCTRTNVLDTPPWSPMTRVMDTPVPWPS